MKTTDSVIVAYDFSHGEAKAVLIVGKKQKNKDVDIINAFQGEEATELWKKLITKKEKK